MNQAARGDARGSDFEEGAGQGAGLRKRCRPKPDGRPWRTGMKKILKLLIEKVSF